MIISYLLSGDFKTALINLFVLMFVVLFINPIHEYAHAFAAYKLGDKTAKNEGRLTLNPLASFRLIRGILKTSVWELLLPLQRVLFQTFCLR